MPQPAVLVQYLFAEYFLSYGFKYRAFLLIEKF